LYLVHIVAFRMIDLLFSHQLIILIGNGKPVVATLLRFAGGLLLASVLAYLSRRSLEERFLRLGYASRRGSVPWVVPAKSPAF
jgi:peptidoglycan/LPS O-acetylase OafA/YrhL